MAQHEPNMVPTLPKMSQHSHSPKWPKISPIWSQLLPNKGQHKPQNTPKMAEHEPNMVPTLAQHPRSAQHGQKWGRRSQNCTLLFCKPARQTTESSQIYQNIPGSRLPRFSCQIIHVGAKKIKYTVRQIPIPTSWIFYKHFSVSFSN